MPHPEPMPHKPTARNHGALRKVSTPHENNRISHFIEILVDEAASDTDGDGFVNGDMSVNPNLAHFNEGDLITWNAPQAAAFTICFTDPAATEPQVVKGNNHTASVRTKKPGSFRYTVEVTLPDGKRFRDSGCPIGVVHRVIG